MGADLESHSFPAGCTGETRLDGCLSGRLLRSREKGGAAVGLTRKGKGTKWMLVVDGSGIPIGFHLDSAGKAEVRLAEQTLRSIRVPRSGRGRPRIRPQHLTADRAYDSRAFRQYLHRRGIGVCIPARRRPAGWTPRRGRPIVARSEHYARRWIVERTFAWLGSLRRLLIRWEHLLHLYQGFFTVALVLLCLRRLLKYAPNDAPVGGCRVNSVDRPSQRCTGLHTHSEPRALSRDRSASAGASYAGHLVDP